MSPSVFITTRKTGKGEPRYVVRFRRGGRYTPLVHAGSFKIKREAQTRRDFIANELAAGRDPVVALRALEQPTNRATLDEWFARFIESRVDVGTSAKALYGNARAKLGALADRDPQDLKPADFQTWIATNKNLAPKTVRHYLSTIRQVLDFADVEPNPARSRKVRLPAIGREEPQPPSGDEWNAIRAQLAPRVTLPVRLMECCALRIGEIVQLTWGDVDFASERLRISRARTKGRTAGQRWLPLPTELLDELEALLPFEDRAVGRFVFGLTEHEIRGAFTRACQNAGVAHYHPHDLRHRRISLWVAHGIDPITLKTWSGHSSSAMSLDVYSHVVIDPASDGWGSFWKGVYTREREARVDTKKDGAEWET